MKIKRYLSLMIVAIMICGMNTFGSSTESTVKPQKKIRIAYCESEPYIAYCAIFNGTLKGLEEKGLVKFNEPIPFKKGMVDTKVIWDWLINNCHSELIQFVPNGWNCVQKMTDSDKTAYMERLKSGKDFDMVFTCGTVATKLTLGKNEAFPATHNTPVMILSCGNALLSNFVKEAGVSKVNNVWALMDPKRYERQIEVFYDIFKFKKLGLVYEDTEINRIYSAIPEIESLSKKMGFEIVRCHITEATKSEEYPQYYETMKNAYNGISNKIDAFYATLSLLEPNQLDSFYKPFYEKKIPVFSQLGESEVEGGALLTVTPIDYKNAGRFIVLSLQEYLNGKKLEEINQIYESSPAVILNIDVARKIQYKVPFEIMLTADELYSNNK